MKQVNKEISKEIYYIVDKGDTKQRYKIKLKPRVKMRATIKETKIMTMGMVKSRVQKLISILRQTHRNETSK